MTSTENNLAVNRLAGTCCPATQLFHACKQMQSHRMREIVSVILHVPSVQPDTCLQDEGRWLGRACVCDLTCTPQCGQTDAYQMEGRQLGGACICCILSAARCVRKQDEGRWLAGIIGKLVFVIYPQCSQTCAYRMGGLG